MKSTLIFLIFVLSLNQIAQGQDAFAKIHSALSNFRDSIQSEQTHANVRFQREQTWCDNSIKKAQAILAYRTKDVKSVQGHISFLNNEITQTTNDLNSKKRRIVENTKTLERFKKERCENNLNYVKSLREHKESIDILKLLRGDLENYFQAWLKKPLKFGPVPNTQAFIEKLTRFSHLFDDSNRKVLIQLMESIKNLDKMDAPDVNSLYKNTDDYTKQTGRTSAQVGKGHVDNNRGELKKLASPGYLKAREFVLELRGKTLGMIDSLIKHLHASRRKLSEDELLANEHFADYQTQMLKENSILAEKVTADQNSLLRLNVQLRKAQATYQRREKLRQQAVENLNALIKACREKEEYHRRETQRRNNELSVVARALATYNKIVTSIHARTLARTNTVFGGKKFTSAHVNQDNVVNYEGTAKNALSSNQKSREEVVF
jgi:hypothetical protein